MLFFGYKKQKVVLPANNNNNNNNDPLSSFQNFFVTSYASNSKIQGQINILFPQFSS